MDYRDRQAADAFAALVSAESASADVVVVSYHGGVEYASAPGPGLDAFLNRLASCGATVVYGHHPHVLQAPRFVYAGVSRRLVLPSMGNFISGQAQYLDPVSGQGAVAPGTGDTALVRVRVLCGAGWSTVIGVDAVPLAVHWNGRGEMVIGRLEDLAGRLAGRVRVGSVLPREARRHHAPLRGRRHFFRARSIASEMTPSRAPMRAPAAAALAREEA